MFKLFVPRGSQVVRGGRICVAPQRCVQAAAANCRALTEAAACSTSSRAGTATGHASADTKTHAITRTLSGGMVDLGTLGGNHSYAAGINDLNTVVGMSDTSTKAAQNKCQAFMRTTVNGMFKLEPQITNLPPSMLLKTRPTRVSDGGQVIGPGAFDPPGTAFVLTPE